MKTIRKSVFETNSSSTHSISIDDSGANYTSITPDRDGNIVLKGGQFGWEIGDFNDPLTKANYCAVDQLSDEDNIKMLGTYTATVKLHKEVTLKVNFEVIAE